MKKKDLIKALFNRTSQQQPNMVRGQIHIYKNKKEHMQMGKSCEQELQLFFFYESYNTCILLYRKISCFLSANKSNIEQQSGCIR